MGEGVNLFSTTDGRGSPSGILIPGMSEINLKNEHRRPIGAMTSILWCFAPLWPVNRGKRLHKIDGWLMYPVELISKEYRSSQSLRLETLSFRGLGLTKQFKWRLLCKKGMFTCFVLVVHQGRSASSSRLVEHL